MYSSLLYKKMLYRCMTLVLTGCFLLNTVVPVYALSDILPLPAPGTLTSLSAPYSPMQNSTADSTR